MTTAPKPAGATDALGDTMRSGIALTAGSQAIRQAIEFCTSVGLARLLLPADFGIVAVVAGFLQLSYVVANLGMTTAVVQADSLSRDDRDGTYTFSAALGLAFTLLFVAISPWVSRFFAMPVLQVAMPIMSLQVFLAGLSGTPLALLRRALDFRKLAVVDIGAAITYAASSLGLAAAGYGIWSLVWAPLVSGTWSVVAAHALSGYVPRPRLPDRSMRRLVSYGSWLTLKNVMVNVSRNGDNLVAAKLLGDTATGFYSRAFNLSTLPQTRIATLVWGICFPVFCRLTADMDRFREWYLKSATALAVVVSPLFVGLFVLAGDVTVALYGERWVGMVTSFKLLCLAALLNSLHMMAGAAMEASGRLRYEVGTEAIYALIVPAGAIVGARYGIEGVACGVAVAAGLLCLMKAFTVRIVIGVPVRRYLAAITPALVAAIVSGEAVYLVVHGAFGSMQGPAGAWTRIAAGAAVGGTVYIGALLVVGRDHLRMVAAQMMRMLGHERRAVTS